MTLQGIDIPRLQPINRHFYDTVVTVQIQGFEAGTLFDL
jgi:hypothetical protein